MRRWILVGLLVVAVAAPAAVVAALATTGGMTGQLDRQKARWKTGSVTTSSTAWRTLPALSMRICAIREVSATLSVRVKGAPVAFRMLQDVGPVLLPGPARFVPSGSESFSFTFVTTAGTFEGNDRHLFEVQWRSPSGRPVRLEAADVNLAFERGNLCG